MLITTLSLLAKKASVTGVTMLCLGVLSWVALGVLYALWSDLSSKR